MNKKEALKAAKIVCKSPAEVNKGQSVCSVAATYRVKRGDFRLIYKRMVTNIETQEKYFVVESDGLYSRGKTMEDALTDFVAQLLYLKHNSDKK